MTLVNAETGELLDATSAERRATKIGLRLDTSAENFEAAMEMMRAAIRDRDDLALGYRSPGDYLSDRFGGKLARLGVDLRREVVRELTEAGLSTREEGSPILRLREQIIKKAAEPGRIPETVILAWVIKAWNDWRTGYTARVRAYQLKSGEKFPEPK